MDCVGPLVYASVVQCRQCNNGTRRRRFSPIRTRSEFYAMWRAARFSKRFFGGSLAMEWDGHILKVEVRKNSGESIA